MDLLVVVQVWQDFLLDEFCAFLQVQVRVTVEHGLLVEHVLVDVHRPELDHTLQKAYRQGDR